MPLIKRKGIFTGISSLFISPLFGQEILPESVGTVEIDSSKADKVITKAAQNLETVADATYLTFGNIISSLLVRGTVFFG